MQWKNPDILSVINTTSSNIGVLWSDRDHIPYKMIIVRFSGVSVNDMMLLIVTNGILTKCITTWVEYIHKYSATKTNKQKTPTTTKHCSLQVDFKVTFYM